MQAAGYQLPNLFFKICSNAFGLYEDPIEMVKISWLSQPKRMACFLIRSDLI